MANLLNISILKWNLESKFLHGLHEPQTDQKCFAIIHSMENGIFKNFQDLR